MTTERIRAFFLLSAGVLVACDAGAPATPERPAPAASPAPTSGPGQSTAAKARQLDAKAVAAATGGKSETSDGVVKVSFPRDDVKVLVDGWAMPPFMGLTSWAGFTPGEKPGVEAMVMGDVVLFQDEVSEAMSAALANGLEVTALHNHFFFDQPKVYFMHIGGEGDLQTLGKGVRAVLDAAKAVRQKSPKPREGFEAGAPPAKNAIDPAKVEAALGHKATAKDGMAKVVVGRGAVVADCGCKVGKTMGVNTWAAFAGTDESALVDGDFAVTEDELQPVLKTLRAGGIHVVAIHHHMTGERPRILFLHYWGRGSVAELGKVLKEALAKTKTKPG